METGVYKKRPFDWSSLQVDKFCPHLYTFWSSGCGANALALLTGVNPHRICNTNRKNPNDWKDSFMIKFLRERGFIVKKITQCDVSFGDGVYTPQHITDNHVLLISQLMNKNEASWIVSHNKLWYHNFQTCSYSGLTHINSPTLTCYVVCHKDWQL